MGDGRRTLNRLGQEDRHTEQGDRKAGNRGRWTRTAKGEARTEVRSHVRRAEARSDLACTVRVDTRRIDRVPVGRDDNTLAARRSVRAGEVSNRQTDIRIEQRLTVNCNVRGNAEPADLLEARSEGRQGRIGEAR